MPKSKNKEADTSLKQGVKCFVQVNGGKGLAFTVTEAVNVEKGESADGYQVYATMEKEMSDADIVEAYRMSR